jgi:hypothetical protein
VAACGESRSRPGQRLSIQPVLFATTPHPRAAPRCLYSEEIS